MARKRKNTIQYQVFAGVTDVMRSALAVLAIIVLLLMLNSLFKWLVKDVDVMFAELRENIGDAILVTEQGK